MVMISSASPPPNVIPAQAGIQVNVRFGFGCGTTRGLIDTVHTLDLARVPAFAGMTQRESGALGGTS
jgi:hypothetical protein